MEARNISSFDAHYHDNASLDINADIKYDSEHRMKAKKRNTKRILNHRPCGFAGQN